MMRRIRGNEEGFTLIEILVVVVLLGIVMGVVYRGLASVESTAAAAEERLINLEEARVLMGTITKDLRTAARLSATESPFLLADGRQVTFYANLSASTGPKRVNIFIDADDRLVEEVIEPAGTAPNYTYGSPAEVRVVGSFVANEASLFTYYDKAGVQLTNIPLSDADRKKVHAIEVSISIRKESLEPTLATTLINRVRLPNVYYDPLSS